MKKVGLVINPISGKGRGPKAAEIATEILKKAGIEVVARMTEKVQGADGITRGNGPAIAAEFALSTDAVVAVGGDGTLSEVIGGVRGHDVPVGIIPVGTANVVSRDLRIPRNPEKAAKSLVAGALREMDVGEVNGRLFLAMVGVGFDGEIVHSIAAARRGPISMTTYVKPTFRTLRDHQPEPLEVLVDGTRLDGTTYGLIICNTRNYGGVFSVTPAAEIDDGWFDYQDRQRPGLFPILRCSIAAAFRMETSKRVARYGRGRTFTVKSARPVDVQVDGDYLGKTPLEIKVLPKAIRIIAPAASKNGVHP